MVRTFFPMGPCHAPRWGRWVVPAPAAHAAGIGGGSQLSHSTPVGQGTVPHGMCRPLRGRRVAGGFQRPAAHAAGDEAQNWEASSPDGPSTVLYGNVLPPPLQGGALGGSSTRSSRCGIFPFPSPLPSPIPVPGSPADRCGHMQFSRKQPRERLPVRRQSKRLVRQACYPSSQTGVRPFDRQA